MYDEYESGKIYVEENWREVKQPTPSPQGILRRPFTKCAGFTHMSHPHFRSFHTHLAEGDLILLVFGRSRDAGDVL